MMMVVVYVSFSLVHPNPTHRKTVSGGCLEIKIY
jgi:hypothetical protein